MAHYCIFRTDRIGDLILTLPMAEAIRRHDADAHVTFVVQEYTRSLAALCPFVDDVIPIPSRDLPGGIGAFSRFLQEKDFDAAFFAFPRPRLAIAAWRAGIRLRAGIAYRWYSFLFTHRRKEHRNPSRFHERDYNLRLLESAGMRIDGGLLPRLRISEAMRAEARTILAASTLDPSRPFVVLHPGSGGSARDWSPDRFGSLAARLGDQGGMQVLVTGSEEELSLVGMVRDGGGENAHVLDAPVSLLQLAAILAEARLCVANSTGPLHLAAAVNTPVVGLYPFQRVLHPRRWGPLGDAVRVLMPPAEGDCADCAAERCPRHDDMGRITVAAVHAEVTALLETVA
ncbi:MAG: glycosyltransferase family 9 protein [Bacteroidota bacterium]|nr:glycosyltransferase family 9 protein [Bacteroidota bacterium]